MSGDIARLDALFLGALEVAGGLGRVGVSKRTGCDSGGLLDL